MRLLAPLLALLLGCAVVRPAPEPVPTTPVVPAEPVADCPVCPTPKPRCGPGPFQPTITWVPPGCPPQFGACITPLDSVALAAYLQAVKAWTARCSDAR
jgi:hypothetical protein